VILSILAALMMAVTQLDSQAVLERYAARLLREEGPKVLVFLYTVSQAGPRDIEQVHRVYRSGDLVRDETLMVDGVRQKSIRIARYRNRYTLENLAPRMTQYAFLFERAARSGTTYTYTYRAVPLGSPAGFIVDTIAIDGRSFLPVLIHFRSSALATTGSGSIAFGKSGKYWVPAQANVQASIRGKPARERITFSMYQFPTSLPKSTFQTAKPLPKPVIPTI
jgi:hypothetical protein